MDLQQYITNMRITTIINPLTGKEYTITRFLGKGGTGVVYEVISIDEYYAMKLTPYIDDYNNELDVYNIISHDPNCNPFIVCLYDSFTIKLKIPVGVLIIELMKNTLNDAPITDDEVPSFILGTLRALVSLHEAGIAHGDISNGNIYRTRLPMVGEPKFKLGDFSGSAIDATPAQKLNDVWSLGYIFLTEVLHVDASQRSMMEILRGDLIYLHRESDIPSDALETMIRGMLEFDTTKRWSSEKALDYILSVIQQ